MGNKAAAARLLQASKDTQKTADRVTQNWEQVGAALWLLNRRTKRHKIALLVLAGMWLAMAVLLARATVR
jgi:hypothetical protein